MNNQFSPATAVNLTNSHRNVASKAGGHNMGGRISPASVTNSPSIGTVLIDEIKTSSQDYDPDNEVDETVCRQLAECEQKIAALLPELRAILKEESGIKKIIDDTELKYLGTIQSLAKDFKALCNAVQRNMTRDVQPFYEEEKVLQAELAQLRGEKREIEQEIIQCNARIVVLEDTIYRYWRKQD